MVSNWKGPIRCIYSNSHAWKTRLRLIDASSYKTFFYPFPVSTNRYGGRCNTIDDSHARVYVSNKVKNMILKAYRQITSVNKKSKNFIMNHVVLNVDWIEVYEMHR